MLLYIVYGLTLIGSGLTQGSNSFNGNNGAYPRSAPLSRPLPRPSQPTYSSPLNSNENGYRPQSPPRSTPELRTGSNMLYPQPENETGILVAQIHGNGIFGYASFLPIKGASNGFHVKVHVNSVSGTNENYIARIFQYPVPNNPSCSPQSLGPLLHDLSNHLIEMNKELTVTIPQLTVRGDKSIIGRTLMLQSVQGGNTICSVIMPGDSSKLVLQGKLHAPLAGMAYLIQNGEGAVLGTEWMMYSDGKRRDDAFTWKLVKASLEDSSNERKVQNEQNRCDDLQGTVIFNSQVLLPVSTESPIWRGRMHTGINPNVARDDVIYLVVYRDNVNIACTTMNLITPKVGLARYLPKENNGVDGAIRLTQDSPFEPTRVSINLKLFSNAFSYGIDVLPSLRRRNKEIKSCPNVKETIYNPFHVDPDRVPAQGQGTADMYAVGDLSGKYGTLESKQNVNLQTWDSNLPLFGYYSVIGRAIVIYGPSGPAVTCANIDPYGKPLTTAYATFDYPVQGQFIFRQPEGECHSDTYLYIEVSKHPSASNTKSSNHMWHVHNNPVTLEESALSTTNCEQAGSHLNPFNVSVSNQNPIYVRDCNIFTPTRCEIGDLANKLGPIDIPPYKPGQDGREPEVAKYYWIDSDLPLCGPSKIVSRSVVIHQADFQMPKMTCANLLVYQPKPANN